VLVIVENVEEHFPHAKVNGVIVRSAIETGTFEFPSIVSVEEESL